MQELSMNEVNEVSGGWVALAALLLAEICAIPQLEEAAAGFYAGWAR